MPSTHSSKTSGVDLSGLDKAITQALTERAELLEALRGCVACGALSRTGADANAANALAIARKVIAAVEGRS